MNYFNLEEARKIGKLLSFEDENPETEFDLVFADGERYRGTILTVFESDNQDEVDAGKSSDLVEFMAVAFRAKPLVSAETRLYDGHLLVTYLDFPVRIFQSKTGAEVYGEQ